MPPGIEIGSVIEPIFVFFTEFRNNLENLLSLIQPNFPPCPAVEDELNLFAVFSNPFSFIFFTMSSIVTLLLVST